MSLSFEAHFYLNPYESDLFARTTWFQLFEKVVTLVIYQDKRREVFTSIFQIAPIPSSGYSTHSMLLILF